MNLQAQSGRLVKEIDPNGPNSHKSQDGFVGEAGPKSNQNISKLCFKFRQCWLSSARPPTHLLQEPRHFLRRQHRDTAEALLRTGPAPVPFSESQGTRPRAGVDL